MVWFTGLSGSGKSTIAEKTSALLRSRDLKVEIIDGDIVRKTLSRHLGFSRHEILENNRLISDLCIGRRKDCDVVMVAVISPFKEARGESRRRVGEPFLEVYIKASLDTVLERDPKGLYARSKEGAGSAMIGLSEDMPYEIPELPDLVLDTEEKNSDELAQELVGFLLTRL